MVLKNILIALIVAAILAPQAAHAVDWVGFFFPSLRQAEPDPSSTLIAPFANPKDIQAGPVQPGVKPENRLPENRVPLDTPHRTVDQVGKWLEMAVSEALTLKSGAALDESLKSNMAHFDAGGAAQYRAFLDGGKVIDTLRGGRYRMNGMSQDVPLLLNQGAVDGRYRWLFEVPVIVTYIESDADGYKNAKPITQSLMITVQVGRTADLSQGRDLVIERWSARARK